MDTVVAAAIGAFFAVVVKPIVDGIGGFITRRRLATEARASWRRERLLAIEEAVVALASSHRTEESKAKLPALASSIDDPALSEAIGRLLSAGAHTFRDEVTNVSTITGRLLKDS